MNRRRKFWVVFIAFIAVMAALPMTSAQAVTQSFPCGTAGHYDVIDGVAKNSVVNGDSCAGFLSIDSSATSIASNAFKFSCFW